MGFFGFAKQLRKKFCKLRIIDREYGTKFIEWVTPQLFGESCKEVNGKRCLSFNKISDFGFPAKTQTPPSFWLEKCVPKDPDPGPLLFPYCISLNQT